MTDDIETIKQKIKNEIDEFIIILTETKYITEDINNQEELQNIANILASNLKNFIVRMQDHMYDLRANTR